MEKITSRVQIREMIVGYDLQNPAFLEEYKEKLVKQIAWKMYDEDFIHFEQEPIPGDKGITMTASCFITRSKLLIKEHSHLTPPNLYPDTEDELFNKLAYTNDGMYVISEVGTDYKFFINRVEHFIDYLKSYTHYSIEELLKMYNYGDAPHEIYHFTGHWAVMQVVYFRYLKRIL